MEESEQLLGNVYNVVTAFGVALQTMLVMASTYTLFILYSVGSNPARRTLLQLVDAPSMCIHDTGRSGVNAVDIPSAMRTSRFCFSPRGWDNGDYCEHLCGKLKPLEKGQENECGTLPWACKGG